MKKIILLLLAVVAMTTKTRAQDMLSTPLSLEAITAGTISMNNPSSSALSSVIAMSWSDEETGEALTNQRYDDEGDGWESYWEYRE